MSLTPIRTLAPGEFRISSPLQFDGSRLGPMRAISYMRRKLRRVLWSLAWLPAVLGIASPGWTQQRSTDFSLTYTQERSAFVGDTSDRYLSLRGATADLGYTFFHGFGVAVSGTGLAATNLRGSIDIRHVQALLGPRYTYNWGHITNTHTSRKGSVFAEGKVGYTLATAGEYPYDDVIDSRASSLTYQGGGGVNLHVYHRFDLRLLEVHYVRTQLPNGGTNAQNTLRLASGINFHFGF